MNKEQSVNQQATEVLNTLSNAIRVMNEIKEEKGEDEKLKELSELVTKSITQQFSVLHRVRKFMDSV